MKKITPLFLVSIFVLMIPFFAFAQKPSDQVEPGALGLGNSDFQEATNVDDSEFIKAEEKYFSEQAIDEDYDYQSGDEDNPESLNMDSISAIGAIIEGTVFDEESQQLEVDVIFENKTGVFVSGLRSALNLYAGDELKEEGYAFEGLERVYTQVVDVDSMYPGEVMNTKLRYDIPPSLEAGNHLIKLGIRDEEYKYTGLGYSESPVYIKGTGTYIGEVYSQVRAKGEDMPLNSGQLLADDENISLLVRKTENPMLSDFIAKNGKVFVSADVYEVAGQEIIRSFDKQELVFDNSGEFLFTLKPWDTMPSGTMSVIFGFSDTEDKQIANDLYLKWYRADNVARIVNIASAVNYYEQGDSLDATVIGSFSRFEEGDEFELKLKIVGEQEVEFSKNYTFSSESPEEINFDFSDEVSPYNLEVQYLQASVYNKQTGEMIDDFRLELKDEKVFKKSEEIVNQEIGEEQKNKTVETKGINTKYIITFFVTLVALVLALLALLYGSKKKGISVMLIMVSIPVLAFVLFSSVKSSLAACPAPAPICTGAITSNTVWAEIDHSTWDNGVLGIYPRSISVKVNQVRMWCNSCLNGVGGSVGLEIQKRNGGGSYGYSGQTCSNINYLGHVWHWKSPSEGGYFDPPGPFTFNYTMSSPGSYRYRVVLNTSEGCKCFPDSWNSIWHYVYVYGKPSVAITSPSYNQTFTEGKPINFNVSGSAAYLGSMDNYFWIDAQPGTGSYDLSNTIRCRGDLDGYDYDGDSNGDYFHWSPTQGTVSITDASKFSVGTHHVCVVARESYGDGSKAWALDKIPFNIVPAASCNLSFDQSSLITGESGTYSLSVDNDSDGKAVCDFSGSQSAGTNKYFSGSPSVGNFVGTCTVVNSIGDSATCSDSVSIVAPVCGDGVKTGSEECDDGGKVNGDGCSSTCLNEYCGDGTPNNSGSETCDDGPANTNTPCTASTYNSSCTYCDTSCNEHTIDGPRCGDSTTDASDGETCDDGVANTDTPCTASTYNSSCTYCDTSCETHTVEGPRCGDGVKNGSEECDDGDTDDTNDCSNTCVSNLSPPAAFIDSPVNGETYYLSDTIDLRSHWYDLDGDSLVSSNWSLSGCPGSDLSTNENDTTTFSTTGSKTIYYQVTTGSPEAPSNCASVTINIASGGGNTPPVADIVEPQEVNSPFHPDVTIDFNGEGTDADGTVVAHMWFEDMSDGSRVSYKNVEDFGDDTLPIGFHSISYRVRDNQGAWSAFDYVMFDVKDTGSNDADFDFFSNTPNSNTTETARVAGGGPIDLNWTTTNIGANGWCWATTTTNFDPNWWGFIDKDGGTIMVSPDVTTRYELECGRGSTREDKKYVTVEVFKVELDSSDSSIMSGQNTTLSWDTTNADNCSDDWSGSVVPDSSGSDTVGPTAVNSYTYTLSCDKNGVNAQDVETLDVTPCTSCSDTSILVDCDPDAGDPCTDCATDARCRAKQKTVTTYTCNACGIDPTCSLLPNCPGTTSNANTACNCTGDSDAVNWTEIK